MKKVIKSKLLVILMLVSILSSFTACSSSVNSTNVNTSNNISNYMAETKASYLYVGSSNSEKYHITSCEWAEKIKSSNLVQFTSKEDASSRGYTACKVCKP